MTNVLRTSTITTTNNERTTTFFDGHINPSSTSLRNKVKSLCLTMFCLFEKGMLVATKEFYSSYRGMVNLP